MMGLQVIGAAEHAELRPEVRGLDYLDTDPGQLVRGCLSGIALHMLPVSGAPGLTIPQHVTVQHSTIPTGTIPVV